MVEILFGLIHALSRGGREQQTEPTPPTESAGYALSVLWVDGVGRRGVSPENIVKFSTRANARVTLVYTVEEAIAEWRQKGFDVLVVNHDLGRKMKGYNAIDAILRLGQPPHAVVIASSPRQISRFEDQQYRIQQVLGTFVNPDFEKLGQKVRSIMDEVRRADGMSPAQMAYLRNTQ